MKKTIWTIFFTLLSAVLLAAGGGEESTPSRSRYLASKGTITLPDEIHVESFISYMDYRYPEPEQHPVGIYLYSGHQQLSTQGQEEVFLVGLQGQRRQIDDIQPLNLAFVIDKSGSMSSEDKMDWVKESFDIFIKRVADKDYVSLVVFDSTARVIFPSTHMGDKGARQRFREAVHSISAGGGTNIIDGLKLGYEQVLSNFRESYINRVLFLTDGLADTTGTYDIASSYKEIGISVSAIGLGQGFDADFIRNLAKEGGGSSRFISDRETMEEIFGTGLGRMTVALAKDLNIEIEFLQNIQIRNTYGYDHVIEGQKISYSIPAVHMGDYETIVIQTRIPEVDVKGLYTVARLEASYVDDSGKSVRMKPIDLRASFVPLDNPVQGVSNATVLKAASMLHYAQTLKQVGKHYYEAQSMTGDLDSHQHRTQKIQTAIDLTNSIKKELVNAQQRLDFEGFEVELSVLEKYLSIMGNEIQLGDGEIARLVRDTNLISTAEERSMEDHVDNLFREIKLDLTSQAPGNIAVSGFSFPDGRRADILNFLDQTAESTLFTMPRYTVLERKRISAVLEEQELSLSDLMETSQAIAVGNLLSAQYILTGTVIEMTSSVTVFARVINVETTAIGSVRQVVIQKDREIVSLLGKSRDIMDLVERNELGPLQQLIEEGADVNRTTPAGYAPLDAAVLNGNTDIVQALVNAGADLNTPRKGCTPLLLAARYKRPAIVRTFMKAGADPEARWEGNTALMIAATNGDAETVRVLLDTGVEIDAQHTQQETTPLMIAVEYGHEDVTRLLIDAGADVDAAALGISVLMRAIDPVFSDGASVAIVKTLLNSGAPVNQKDNRGYTPLIRAVVSAVPEIVQVLLEAGADVSAADASGRTAEMWAEKMGKTEIAALLQTAG